MKLRMRGSSIRLRLTRGEVDVLAGRGRVEESAVFPGGERLSYALVAREDAPALTASLEGAAITVVLPAARARAWAVSDEVGLEALVPVVGGEPLRLYVEKDFACLKPRGEDDADAFENPSEASGERC